jgi:hypothetical protein
MHVHYGYGFEGNKYSNSRISGYSQGCLNFQNYQGQAGFFQTLHKIKDGKKLKGNNGNTFVCNSSPGSGINTWSKESRNKPWGKVSSALKQYNFHFMLLSQLKKPSIPIPKPTPTPPPNPGPPPLPPNKI